MLRHKQNLPETDNDCRAVNPANDPGEMEDTTFECRSL